MISKIRELLFTVWVWIGHKCFGWHYIDIYAPKDGTANPRVVGITFSSSEKYVNQVNSLNNLK